jgi:hypothetical protein
MTFLADAVLAAVCFAASLVILTEIGRMVQAVWRELR